MPSRLLNFVSRSSHSHAKDIIKSSLQDVSSATRRSSTSLSSEKNDPHIMDVLKRHSISLGRHLEKKGSPSLEPSKAAKLDLVVESPPLISFNQPQHSSGALFSGQLRLDVVENKVTFESIELQLLSSVSVKKPVGHHCADCSTKSTELKKWTFAKEPLTLDRGEHRFPVSYLFEGNLPATTHSHLAILDYHFIAKAKTTTGDTITHGEIVELGRAVIPGNDKQSVRIFPPTNITAHTSLNPIVHPIGEFPVSLHLSGVTSKLKESIIRWRLRRLNWRIEEHLKMYSAACAKHAPKLSSGGGLMHEEIRTVGEHEVSMNKNPWKSDFINGEIDCEFQCTINPAKKPACNVEDPKIGLSIQHFLVLEMVVAEEWCPAKRPTQSTPTGSARILRAQFALTLTLRAGLGISWDEETPPVYQEVPASPPSYVNVQDFDLSELDDHIDSLHLGEPREGASSTSLASSSRVITGQRPSSVTSSPRFNVHLLSAEDLMHEPLSIRQAREERDEEERGEEDRLVVVS